MLLFLLTFFSPPRSSDSQGAALRTEVAATGSCHPGFSLLVTGSLAPCQLQDKHDAGGGIEGGVGCDGALRRQEALSVLPRWRGGGACCHADVLMGSAVDNERANGNLIRKLACHLDCLPSYPQPCRRSGPLSLVGCDVGMEK